MYINVMLCLVYFFLSRFFFTNYLFSDQKHLNERLFPYTLLLSQSCVTPAASFPASPSLLDLFPCMFIVFHESENLLCPIIR